MAGSLNPFVYAEANPINLIDPLGLKPCTGNELDMCTKLCKSRGADVLVCEQQTTCGWAGDISLTACTCTDHDRWGGYREGKPEVPEGSTKVGERVQRKVKSQDFKDFLDKHDIKRGGWNKVMEKYRTPDGRIIKKHWWEGPGGRSFHHL